MMPFGCEVICFQRLASSGRKTELGEIAHQHLGVEDPHHQLFAEGRRQRGQAQLDLLAVGRARLDAAVLRPALLHHVHAAEDLDAAGHRASTVIGIWYT
jgi:hypothetical protein